MPSGTLNRVTVEALARLCAPVWIYDLARTQIWWANAAALSLFASPDLDALRRSQDRDPMTDGMRRRLAIYREHFVRGESLTEQWTFYPEGVPPVVAECTFSGVPIDDEHGERLAMLVEAQLVDVSARGGNERRLVEALRHCNEFISLYSLKGVALLRNPSAEQTLGVIDAGNPVQALTKGFVVGSDAERAIDCAKSGAVFRSEVRVHTTAGEAWHELELRGVVDPLSGERALLAVQHDVTARRKSEERLAAAGAEAEVLRDKADAANRAKSAFLAIMSHELRTPMTGVLTATELLTETNLDQEQSEILDMAMRAGAQMLSLVDDILDVSRIEAGRMSLDAQPLSIRALVAETLRPLHVNARRKGLTLTATIDPQVPTTVLLDRRRVAQILSNLVINAIKFTYEGSVEVRVRPDTEVEGPWLRIEVIDTGIGMDPQGAQGLFSAFVQANTSDTRTHGGAGLGLHIVRLLTDAMDGEIGVNTEPGVGSTFWVRILAPVAAATERPEAPTQKRRSLQMDVLLVDDNGPNRVALGRLLTRWGCQVRLAVDGLEALRLVGEAAPEVILMDVMMPGMDGPATARAIRADEMGGRRTPIIGLTADSQFADAGDPVFDDCLRKPVDWNALYDALRTAVPGTE